MVLFWSDFEEFRSFSWRSEATKSRLSDEGRASFAILAEQALEKQEIIHRNGKKDHLLTLMTVNTLNSYKLFWFTHGNEVKLSGYNINE